MPPVFLFTPATSPLPTSDPVHSSFLVRPRFAPVAGQVMQCLDPLTTTEGVPMDLSGLQQPVWEPQITARAVQIRAKIAYFDARPQVWARERLGHPRRQHAMPGARAWIIDPTARLLVARHLDSAALPGREAEDRHLRIQKSRVPRRRPRSPGALASAKGLARVAGHDSR
jgi:hypothetical protein